MHNVRTRRAIVLAAAGVLLAAAAVLADTIRADGDVVTPGVQGLVELGQVAPSAVIHVDVAFQLECSGTNKHVDANQSVTLTLASRTVPPGGNATGTAAVINPPGSGWPVDGTDCSSLPNPIVSATNSHVTLTAPPTPGVGWQYTLNYTRSLSPISPNDPNTFTGSTNVTFRLDVVTNTPPVLTVPANMTVEGDTTGGAGHVTFAATATDAEDNPDPTPTCSPVSGSFFALGTTTVGCSVTDSGGLTTTGSFTVTVVDTTAPTMSGVPADISLVTNDPAGATITYVMPTATDVVDARPSVSCSPASGSLAPVGDSVVTCTAADASGNSTTRTFSVSVHLNAPPVLSLPANRTVEGDTTGGAHVAYAVTATDAEDNPDPTPVCAPAGGSLFTLGATTVTCSVTDSGGLTATGSFTVTVVDTTAPSLSGVPAGLSLVTNDPAGATISYSLPTATDIVDANPTVSCSPASGSLAPVGASLVTCTATDGSGNSTTQTFPVSVHLNAGPVLILPANVTVEGNTTGGARVTFVATATDAEDNPDPSPTCTPASGSVFGLGATTVSCNVTDSGGLTDRGTFRVTVVDTTAPTLSGGPGSLSLTTTDPAGAILSYTAPTATDVVDAHPSVSCSPASGARAPVGDSFIYCDATDASGNTAGSRFPVHVTLLTTDTWSAAWDEPIGGLPVQVTANSGRTLPVKLRLYRNGSEIVTGSAFLRIVPCGATAPAIDIPLVFGGRWTAKLDTSMLSGDCFRVSAMVGAAEAGSFRLDISGYTPVRQPSKSPAKSPKP
jgi:hypothetical protein